MRATLSCWLSRPMDVPGETRGAASGGFPFGRRAVMVAAIGRAPAVSLVGCRLAVLGCRGPGRECPPLVCTGAAPGGGLALSMPQPIRHASAHVGWAGTLHGRAATLGRVLSYPPSPRLIQHGSAHAWWAGALHGRTDASGRVLSHLPTPPGGAHPGGVLIAATQVLIAVSTTWHETGGWVVRGGVRMVRRPGLGPVPRPRRPARWVWAGQIEGALLMSHLTPARTCSTPAGHLIACTTCLDEAIMLDKCHKYLTPARTCRTPAGHLIACTTRLDKVIMVANVTNT